MIMCSVFSVHSTEYRSPLNTVQQPRQPQQAITLQIHHWNLILPLHQTFCVYFLHFRSHVLCFSASFSRQCVPQNRTTSYSLRERMKSPGMRRWMWWHLCVCTSVTTDGLILNFSGKYLHAQQWNQTLMNQWVVGVMERVATNGKCGNGNCPEYDRWTMCSRWREITN